MMGDRDFRSMVKNAVDTIGRELEVEIDAKNIKTIHLKEVVQCLRRSYYDRIDPKEVERRGFNDLLSGLLRKLHYGSDPKEFSIDEIKLRGQADMIVDDSIVLFRPSKTVIEAPVANDLLYLNACMWIYDKTDGIIVYITGDREEIMFSLTRDKKMFEEIIRRVRVLNDLLKEQKTPILEPSNDCAECQYYQRCFTTKKNTKQVSLAEMIGLGKD
ncbi:Dna2/Cas4 domain-containing protein [Candidatus Nitrosarchaeum limnium]|jgi:CRISPR-associated exonuclease Cas4|nr:Dna2/Cas4 domain-containing protein [Candidatus Nitrosarchaeum limnium]